MNKSYFEGILILVSSLVFPCAVMEYTTPIFRSGQVWIFLFGVYYHEWEIGPPGISQFLLFSSMYQLLLISIIAIGICMASGVILTTEVITLRRSTELTKTIFLLTFLLFIFQVTVIIVAVEFLVGISLSMVTCIFPLPIPFLIAILMLRYKGFRFMRESYFQGFLIFISSLMLPFAVVGFESNRQEWLFPFGVCHLMFNEHLVRAGFFMPFFLERWFPYFIILAVVWMTIGLILAAEVIKLWESKELTRTAFSFFILLLTLEIVCPILVGLLVYSWCFDIKYIIPIPIPVLVVILLLKRSGVTFMLYKNQRGF